MLIFMLIWFVFSRYFEACYIAVWIYNVLFHCALDLFNSTKLRQWKLTLTESDLRLVLDRDLN